MHANCRIVALAIALLSSSPGDALSSAAANPWAAFGFGIAPSPYGLDGNGSLLGDFAVGRVVRHRVTIVGSVGRYEFRGRTRATFTQIAIGIRAHLSTDHASLGGPYLGVAPVLCHSRFRESAEAADRILPGFEAVVGTVIPLSGTFAIDWSASHVITPDASGLAPDPTTRSTKRDGLDRGAMRVRLVLMR